MIFDLDDYADDDDSARAYRYLWRLKEANLSFKATLFAIPGRCTVPMLRLLPEWVEVAVHGWYHPSPHEAERWEFSTMEALMEEPIVQEFFVQGFKAPGWQISDGCYEALLWEDWWVADQPYNDDRRPKGLRCHLLGSPDHFHGHVGSAGVDNGIQDVFPQALEMVRQAESFEFVSEAVKPWTPSKSRA